MSAANDKLVLPRILMEIADEAASVSVVVLSTTATISAVINVAFKEHGLFELIDVNALKVPCDIDGDQVDVSLVDILEKNGCAHDVGYPYSALNKLIGAHQHSFGVMAARRPGSEKVSRLLRHCAFPFGSSQRIRSRFS